MLASLYGNPHARLDDGNDQIHKMYVSALGMMPYIKASTGRSSQDKAELIEEWRRMNAEEAKSKLEAAEAQGGE